MNENIIRTGVTVAGIGVLGSAILANSGELTLREEVQGYIDNAEERVFDNSPTQLELDDLRQESTDWSYVNPSTLDQVKLAVKDLEDKEKCNKGCKSYIKPLLDSLQLAREQSEQNDPITRLKNQIRIGFDNNFKPKQVQPN